MVKLYYEDEHCAIYLGDSRDGFPGEKCDVVIADPPYNIGFKYENYKDLMPDKEYFALLRESFGHSGARSILWFWQGMRVAAGQIGKVIPEGYRFHHLAGWFRKEYAGDLYSNGHPTYCWEPICWIARPAKNLYKGPRGGAVARDMVSALGSHRDLDAKDHPCNKPLGAVKAAVIWASDPGEVIYDPFGGSGTTMKAAAVLGRKGIMVEVEEKYCEVAAKRMEQTRKQIGLFDAAGLSA